MRRILIGSKFRTKANLLILLGSFLASSFVNAEDMGVIELGVVPQQSARVLAKNWTPLTQHLTEELGVRVKFATAKDIPTFEERLAEKKYQLSYMNPYHFVHFNEVSGYQALAKQKDKRIKGIFIKRKDSPIESLSDLNGHRLAFPAPAAFAASILTRGTLEQNNVEFTPQYVSSHDSVYLSVAKGVFPAGGGVVRTFQLAPPSVQDQLEILHTTKPFTPHAFAFSQELEPQFAQKVLQALLQLTESEKGKQILKNINIKSFESAKNEDWNDVKSLNLSELMRSE